MGWRIGIDLGGTKIEAALMDDAGEIVASRRLPTPRGDYQATLEAIAGVVHRFDGEVGGEPSVGMGTPGAWLTKAGVMQNCNSTWLNGQPLLTDLESRLGARVRLANDADCMALSEAVDGAGAGFRTVFGVILGTGVGGGLVVDGRLLAGANGIAGEWGHTPLPYLRRDALMPPELAAFERKLLSRACYCGRSDCVETYLSGPGLAATHEALSGEQATAAELGVRAARGDGAAGATLRLYSVMLARSLAQIINVIDPEVVVLGGGVSNVDGLYRSVPQAWAPYVFSTEVVTRLEPARHGDSSGVRGAAWLWPAPL